MKTLDYLGLETGILGKNPKKYVFTYFEIFEEKKIFRHFW